MHGVQDKLFRILSWPEFAYTPIASLVMDDYVAGKCHTYHTAEYGSVEGWVKPLFENMRPFNLLNCTYSFLCENLPVDFDMCKRVGANLLSIDGSGINGKHLSNFVPTDAYTNMTIWNSPLIKLGPPEELFEMKAIYDRKTRYKMRQAFAGIHEFGGMPSDVYVSFGISNDLLLEFAGWLKARWKFSDYTHALGQLLYAVAHPNTIMVAIRSKETFDTIGCMIFIVEQNIALHQATLINPKYEVDNYGAILYAASIQSLHSYDTPDQIGPIKYLDPSCVTNPYAASSIDVYKRLFVNTRNLRYSFYMTGERDPECDLPPLYDGESWCAVKTDVMDSFTNRELMQHDG